MSISDILGHLCSVLYLVAVMFRNMMWLRMFMVMAATMNIGYCLLGMTNPWTSLPWVFMTIAVNGYHFVRLLIEKGTINFNAEERALHQTVFPMLDVVQCKRMLKVGRWHTFEDRAEIIPQGVECKDLVLIVNGNAAVEIDGHALARISSYSFAGEMSYLTHQKTSARVAADGEVRCLIWDGGTLRKVMKKDQSLELALQGVLNKILISKLTETNRFATAKSPA